MQFDIPIIDGNDIAFEARDATRNLTETMLWARDRSPSIYLWPEIDRRPFNDVQNNRPWTGHDDFRLIEHRFSWGLSRFWDTVTSSIDGARHRYDLAYSPSGATPFRTFAGVTWSSDFLYENQDDYYPDDEEPDEEGW